MLHHYMHVDFYTSQLLILSFICAISYALERHVSNAAKRLHFKDSADARLENGTSHGSSSAGAGADALSSLTRKYLLVYAVVMGADWLQGPYVYSLYREQYHFPERMVAVFFVTGFLSAGLAAPMVGAWADQYGRRRLCLVFCLTYALSCVCIAVPFVPVLFFGRLLGGLSTSILFSAFESWLVSTANSLSLPSSDLSTIMGRANLVNGIVATVAGVASNQLVLLTGGGAKGKGFVSPFVASAMLLVLAWFVIRKQWTEENYGSHQSSRYGDVFQLRRLAQAWRIVRKDPFLLILGLTQTCFEGSMYLFVFLWVPSLQEHAARPSRLPFGYIFSSFMVSMMLGSLFYTALISHHQHQQQQQLSPSRSKPAHHKHNNTNDGDSSLTLHAKLSSLVCAFSALSLATSVAATDERWRFWAFCVFEACVGMYYPVQGTLRGTLISNEHRATLSSLFRVPLNIFVVLSLLTGVSEARTSVLSAASLLLCFSAIMTGLVIVPRSEEYVVPSGGGAGAGRE